MSGGTLDPNLQKIGELNELGYKGPVPVKPKPVSEYRIAIIGGSTVLIGDPSISQLTEQYFKENNYPNVRVYNFGVAASTLRMDIARLIFEIREYDPDLVVFYGGGNDIGMPFQADTRPGYPPNFIAYEYNPLLTAGTEEQSWLTLFRLALLHSRLTRTFIGIHLRIRLVPLEELRKKYNWNTEAWSQNIVDTYLSEINFGNTIGKAFNSKVIFIFQPLLYFKKTLSEGEKLVNNENLVKHAQFCREKILNFFSDNKKLNVNFSDISSIFDDTDEEVFNDGIHIHQKFQPIISKAVYEAILKVVEFK